MVYKIESMPICNEEMVARMLNDASHGESSIVAICTYVVDGIPKVVVIYKTLDEES